MLNQFVGQEMPELQKKKQARDTAIRTASASKSEKEGIKADRESEKATAESDKAEQERMLEGDDASQQSTDQDCKDRKSVV